MRRKRLIKIGYSSDLSRRAAELNAVVLAKTPGGLALEQRLHARFAPLRRHGEWFEPGPGLMELINGPRGEAGLGPVDGRLP